MNLRQVADLVVVRLGLPIPMAKLVTMQAIAQELSNEETSQAFAESLAAWLSTRELESECLEALCPLLVTAPRPDVVALIRKAIRRPSIASDALLSIATGSPNLVASWTGNHSGPVSRYDDLREEVDQLRAGTFIPPIFSNRLERLKRETGRPFLTQWGFEFRQMLSRHGGKSDGHLEYFCGTNRQAVGQFVARQGHLARSAYLRTLALAVDHWDMPMPLASSFAEVAFPADAIFLRFPPQPAPAWADSVQSQTATEMQDAPAVAESLIDAVEAAEQGRLMHCSFTVVDEPKVRVDFQAFAVGQARDGLNADKVIQFYVNLLGEISPDRDALRAFVLPDLGPNGETGLGFAPLMLPLIGNRVGYLQSDLLGRIPYVPVSSRDLPDLELVPSGDRAVFRSNGQDVGSWAWWCWKWRATHGRGQPPSVACCASLTHDAARALVSHLGGGIDHAWRITTWTRESDYEAWHESKVTGLRKTI